MLSKAERHARRVVLIEKLQEVKALMEKGDKQDRGYNVDVDDYAWSIGMPIDLVNDTIRFISETRAERNAKSESYAAWLKERRGAGLRKYREQQAAAKK